MFVYSIVKRIRPFWFFQIGGWGAYAIVLLLSSIPFASDRGAIAYRSALAISCFVGSFVLRVVCRRQWRQGFRFPRSLVIVLVWSSILTCLCAAIALKVEYALGTELRPFILRMGLTAMTSAGFIFLSWSALYFGIKYYQTVEAERRRVLVAERSARESELRALRYQVHPHFLFNTLNNIYFFSCSSLQMVVPLPQSHYLLWATAKCGRARCCLSTTWQTPKAPRIISPSTSPNPITTCATLRRWSARKMLSNLPRLDLVTLSA